MTQYLDFEKPLAEIEGKAEELRAMARDNPEMDIEKEAAALDKKAADLLVSLYAGLSPWRKCLVARHPQRPHCIDYIDALFTEYTPLAGDRNFADDHAIMGGIARFDGKPVMVIGHEKGNDTKSRIERNFGMARPEGYRKAIRLMEMASKFGLPVITLVDTPGAYPGIDSEERHVSEAIAVNLREMAMLKVPTMAVVVGEGGSGGALGIGVTDRVVIFENSYYSVISPEGCAAILWKDGAAAPQAAEALKLNAATLKKLGVVDEVIPEPMGGAHYEPDSASQSLDVSLKNHLKDLKKLSTAKLLDARYERYRKLGVYQETVAAKKAS